MSVRMAPFGLLRVAALPIEPLVALAPPRTTRCIDAAVAALSGMERLRAIIEDALHAAVPSLPPRTRSAALEIRRSVHNRRPPKIDTGMIDDVLAALPDDARRRLTRWLACERECAANLAAAHASYADEITGHVRPGLRALGADEALLRPLALASPSLLAQWTKSAPTPIDRLDATKLERSVLLYIARAATKTSPFSVFMHQALANFAPGAAVLPQLDPDDRDSRAYLNRHVLFLLYRDAVACADEDAPRFMLNASIAWGDNGTLRALVPDYVIVSDRLLRRGVPATFRLHPILSCRLAALPSRFSVSALRRLLIAEGLKPEAAERFSLQLRTCGLVRPEPFTTGFDDHPEQGCAAALKASRGSQTACASASLEELAAAARSLPGAPSRERIASLERSRAQVDCARGALGGTCDETPPNLLWEDGFFRRPVGPLGTGVTSLLYELARALRPHAVVSTPYRVLTEYFVARYGSGGTCDDLQRFLSDAATALAARTWWLTDPCTEPAVEAGSPVAVTAMVQFSATDEASLAGGHGSLVLNQVYPGCGWLSARYAFGDTAYHRRLRMQLAAWLATVHAPAEPVDVMLSGDCNTLQAHPRLTRRVLQSPIEPHDGRDDGIVSIGDVTLSHDALSGRLQLRDSSGVVFAPVYLGTTVPHPTWGPEFWLATLACPARVDPPTEEITPPQVLGTDLVAIKRRSVGRVILGRASWWMASDRMRRLWYRRAGAGRLLDVAADCSALGMPRRVFVRPPRSAALSAQQDHKPLWVDTRNPFCLDVLSRLAARTNWLLITEALPDVPAWPTLSEQAHVSDLLVEMVI